jgi:hypothetical protein
MMSIRTVVRDEVKSAIEPMEERLNQRFVRPRAATAISEDRSLEARTGLLRAGQKLIKDAMVRKGVASESVAV